MLEEGRISYKQLILLILVSRSIITITYLPALNEPPANQDSWLASLLYYPIQLLIALPIYFLWKRFPDQTIIQYSQTLFGKLGKVFGVLILWYFLHSTALALSQYGFFLTTAVMPETPILFFALTLVLISAYATTKGLEVIGRLSELFTPLIMFAIITIFFLLFNNMNLKILTPVLEKGVLPILQGSWIYNGRSIEVLELAMLLPYLNTPKKVKSVFLISFALVSIFFVITTIPVLTVFGVTEAQSRAFPVFSVIRLVRVGDFLERIESVHMAIWTLGAFIKVTINYYLIVLGLSQLCNLKEYKPLILPIGTILIPLSLLVGPSIVELREFLSYKTLVPYSYFFILFLPCLLLLAAIVRKKGVTSR